MRRWCFGVALISGCYRPAFEAPCSVNCRYTADHACPGDLECMPDNVCHARGGGCGDEPDALVVGDKPGQLCHGSNDGLLRVCIDVEPTGMVTLVGTIDTGSDPICTPYQQG